MSESGDRYKGGSDRTGPVATNRDGVREKRTSDASDENQKRQKTGFSKMAIKVGNSNLSDKQQKKVVPVTIKLGEKKPKEPDIKVKPKKSMSVAEAFGEDSDSEPEEMPPEAKMRMRNVGRETPTSAGPNSFNKSKQGFTNLSRAWRLKKEEEIAKAIHEKSLKEKELLDGDTL